MKFIKIPKNKFDFPRWEMYSYTEYIIPRKHC